MLKRARWLATGAAVGFGGSVWLQRKVRAAADRLGPNNVAVAAANRARDALAEGRTAMREREAELRGGRTAPPSSARGGGRRSPKP